jgi:hypothetical protein
MPLPTHSADIYTTETSAAGSVTPLGTEVMIAGSTNDQTLFWVTSAGAIAGGPQYGPYAASTDVEVVLPGDMGEQVWVKVFNDDGATIERGAICVATAATDPFKVSATTGVVAPFRVVGAAQYDIPDQEYGWLLKKGVGELLSDGSVTAGSALITDANAGQVTDAGADDSTESHLGWALEAQAGAGSLFTARIDCRG